MVLIYVLWSRTPVSEDDWEKCKRLAGGEDAREKKMIKVLCFRFMQYAGFLLFFSCANDAYRVRFYLKRVSGVM